MPSLDELANQKTNRYDIVPAELFKLVEDAQRELFSDAIALINQLEVENGVILTTSKNSLLIDEIVLELKSKLPLTSYTGTLTDFAKEFDTQNDLTIKVFEKAFEDISITTESKLIASTRKRRSIEALVGDSLNAPLFNLLIKELDNAVSSGASLGDTLKSVRLIIEGSNDVDGKLLRYHKQISSDAFSTTDRAFTDVVANDNGAEWVRWVGGTVTDTRCLCGERNNNYYHIKEVREWGALKNIGKCRTSNGWQGRIPNTNSTTITINMGGFNCKHGLIWVSAIVVPKSVLQRNIANGNFKPTAFEKEALNL